MTCGGQCVRITSLLVGCLLASFSMAPFAMNVYLDDVKTVFFVSQSQVELMISGTLLGGCFGLPAGYLIDRVGSTWTFLMTAVLGTVSSLLLYLATLTPSFYHRQFWLIIIYSMLFGMSCITLLVCTLAICILNFCSRHRGKVVGLLGCLSLCGPSALAFLYTECFMQTKDIGSYWLVLTIVNCLTCLLGALFVRDYSHLVDECTNNPETASLKISKDNDGHQQQDHYGLTLFTQTDFHLLCWPHVICCSVQQMIIFNMVAILESFSLDDLKVTLLTTLPLVSAVAKVFVGMLSDHFIMAVPRTFYISVGTWCQTVTIFLLSIYGQFPAVAITCLLIVYLSNALYFSIYPAFLSEIFGKRYFSINWGGILLGNALLAYPLLFLFGYLYDQQVEEGEHNCHCPSCFTFIFYFSGMVSAISAVLMTIMVPRERRWRNGLCS